MESLGGIGFSNTSSATRKKRSTTLRRPWNERQLHDASSLPSTPIPDNNENKIEDGEAVESDEGSTNGSFQGSNQVRQSGGHSTASTETFLVPTKRKDCFDENTIKKVKLKLGGLSKVVNAVSSAASDGASDIGLCSTKSSHASLETTTSKADSCNDGKTNTYPVRKSNRISKRRVLDEDLDDDDEDEEIQFLKKVKMAKVVDIDDEDGEMSRKHKKLSKVMKQNVEYPRGGVGTLEKSGKKSGKAFEDADFVKDEEEDDEEEEEEAVSEAEVDIDHKSVRTRRRAAEEGLSEIKTEMTVTTRRRSGHGGNQIEFPSGLPPAPPRKRKENGLEVDQQLKKTEAAQRRKMQVEKAARESEAEAIRKILGQDSSRKKKEDKIKKRQEEKAKEKVADSIARRSDTVKWVMGPSGTVVTFPEELGLPTIFNSTHQSYPPPRERCAGPECTNTYKYRDSESNLPLCSLRCYKAIKG